MRTLRTAVLTLAGGIVIAFLLFEITISPSHILCCPVNTVVTDYGGINPWTGEDRPMTVIRYGIEPGSNPVTLVWEHDRSPFIPLPVGFAVGSLLALGLIAVVRRSRTPSKPAVSIA